MICAEGPTGRTENVSSREFVSTEFRFFGVIFSMDGAKAWPQEREKEATRGD